MTKFMPIFPLELVVFPTEALRLHIFEPKYIEMVNDCIASHSEFGILPTINGSVKDYCTGVEITEIVKRHDDGSLDIKTNGVSVYRILELLKTLPNKSYYGAIVSDVDSEPIQIGHQLSTLITNEVKRLFNLLNDHLVSNYFNKFNNSYDIAHKVGLTIEQEFELLLINNEMQRQEYIRRHLKNMEPMLIQLEQLKEQIRMNGYFKTIQGTNL